MSFLLLKKQVSLPCLYLCTTTHTAFSQVKLVLHLPFGSQFCLLMLWTARRTGSPFSFHGNPILSQHMNRTWHDLLLVHYPGPQGRPSPSHRSRGSMADPQVILCKQSSCFVFLCPQRSPAWWHTELVTQLCVQEQCNPSPGHQKVTLGSQIWGRPDSQSS